MEAETLPSKARVKSHGHLLRELEESDDFSIKTVVENVEHDEDLEKLKEFIQSPASGIKVTKPNVPMQSFVGLKEVKRDILGYLQKSVIGEGGAEEGARGGAYAPFVEREDDFEHNDRILLFGETGAGKSHLIQAIASELKANLIDFSCFYQWESKMEQCIKALYEMCKTKGLLTVLYLKHFDLFCIGEEEKRVMIRFIRTVQATWEHFEMMKNDDDSSAGSRARARLILFASSNKPHLLDEKLVYGFDRRIYIPTLNLNERKQLFLRKIQSNWKLGHVMTPRDLDWLTKKTYAILTSEIEKMVDNAVHVQYPKWPGGNEHLTKGIPKDYFGNLKWRPLQIEDFVEAARGFLVMDPKSFFEFETFQGKFGNGPFMRLYEREDYDADSPSKKGKKKGGLVWTVFSWL